MNEIAFESEGVRILVTTDRAEVAPRLREALPPNAQPCAVDAVSESFGIAGEEGGTYTFTRSGSPVSDNVDLEFALMMMETQIRIFVGLNATDRIFVHAGVVAVDGRAVVLPGRSFSGKTSLVAAFLRAGAGYLSDEFAVFDTDGQVHPYPTRLSLRGGDETRHQVDASDLGAEHITSPLAVAAIVLTSYVPGGEWAPEPLTPGRVALALIDNTVAALERPHEAMPVFKQVADGPLLLAGERGEAGPVVKDLLARIHG